jgi:O-antigen ligase/polysaccharide polymerase Wzy-like membrane protein
VIATLYDKRVEATVIAGTLALAIAMGAGLAYEQPKYVLAGFAAVLLSIAALTSPRNLTLYALPALILVPPTVRIPIVGSGLTPLRVVVAFGVAGWAVSGRRTLRMPTAYRLAGLVFSVYVMLLASSYGLTSISRGVAYSIESLAIAWLAWKAIGSRRDLSTLLDVLICVMCVAALLAVYETAVDRLLLPVDEPYFFHAPLRGGAIRAQGIFPHPLVLGTALAVMLPVAITRSLNAIGWRRLLAASAALLYALTLVLISGRGPWIGAAVAVLALIALLRGSTRLAVIAGVLVCIVGVAASPLGGKISSLATSVVSNEISQEGVNSVRYRKALLAASISYSQTHLFGTGPNREETAHLTGTLEAGTHLTDSIDNAYAKYAVELGPVGLFLFLLIIINIVLCAWRGHKVNVTELALTASGILAGEIAILVTSATVATFGWQQLAALFWLLVGASMTIGVLAQNSVPPVPIGDDQPHIKSKGSPRFTKPWREIVDV